MELRNNIKSVKTNIESSQAFSINHSAKAFKILSDGIYSDKITAVIRELSTNAYDAHVEAGKQNVPFIVHMPNKYEPFFSVKDMGVGMDHNKVMDLYSSYFGSDKTSSNKFVGALGLGSKSPFAYTDAFSVESLYNGMKRIYFCFISSSGIPRITIISETKTELNNGMTIIVPVENKDFYAFTSKAKSVFEVFSTIPVIQNLQKEYDFTPNETKYEGKDWRILKKNNNVGVIQGNIYYPLNLDALKTPYLNLNYEVQEFFDRNGIELNFKIGEVDITASREALSYDKITIKNIIKKLERIFSHLKKTIQKEVDKIDTYWAARIHYNNINLGNKSYLHIKYGTDAIENNRHRKLSLSGKIFVYKGNSWNKKIVKEELKMGYKGYYSISPNKNTIFIYNDTDKKLTGVSLARKLATEGKDVYYMREANKQFIKGIGSPEVMLASLIPKVERKKVNIDARTAKRYYKYDRKTNLAIQLSTMSDMPKGRKIFMFTSNKKHEIHTAVVYAKGENHSSGSIQKLSELMEKIEDFLPKRFTFMLVYKDEYNKKRFTKEKGWTNLITYIEKNRSKVLDKYKNELDFINKIGVAKRFISTYNYDEQSVINNKRILKEISPSSMIHKAHKTFKMYSEIAYMDVDAKQLDMKDFYSFLTQFIDTAKFFNEDKKDIKYDKIFDKYPMLKHVSNYILKYDDEYNKDLTGIIDYINMVDAK